MTNETAISANLTAAAQVLDELVDTMKHAAHEAQEGNCNGAIGSVFDAEEKLNAALNLVAAAKTLHRLG